MNNPWTTKPRLHRTGEVRPDPQGLARLWAEPGSRLLVVDAAGRFVVRAQEHPAIGEPTSGSFDETRHVLLGTTQDDGTTTAWFAVRGEVEGETATLRDAEVGQTLHEVATAAIAVLAWHDSTVRCERCGGQTRMACGGFQRECDDCGKEAFPRHDPAMIVAVLDADDRLLLAHQASWAPGRVSILAGFLEAGESAEHAVVREVAEESGLQVEAVRYLASQAWPFPRSLMLGFVARGHGELQVDEREIAWARWFSRDELDAAIAAGEVTHPPNHSIASRIIALWRDGRLPAPEDNPLLAR